MKTIGKIFLVISFFAWISCEENTDPVIDDSELLLGYWINPVYNDTILSFERAADLKEDAYGFGFKTGHLFVERKNIGWCGTPPVTYGDEQGKWARHDSLVDIEVPYWGGTAYYKWKIISLDNSSLTIAVVKQEYEE